MIFLLKLTLNVAIALFAGLKSHIIFGRGLCEFCSFLFKVYMYHIFLEDRLKAIVSYVSLFTFALRLYYL